MNVDFKKILRVTLLMLSVALVGFMTVVKEFIDYNNIWDVIFKFAIMIVGGFVVNYIHIILHELGHYFGGLVGGYKLQSFRIGFIDFYNSNGKIKVRFQKLKNNYAGLCQMVPTNSEKALTGFYRFVFGGLFMSAVVTALLFAVVILPFFVTVNTYLYLAVCCGFPLTLMVFLTNASASIQVMGMTDGMYLKAIKRNLPDGVAAVQVQVAQSMMSNGVRPRDIGEDIMENFPVLPTGSMIDIVVKSNKFSYYLDKKDYDSAIKTADSLYAILDQIPDVYLTAILSDIFYSECVLKGNIQFANDVYMEISDEIEANPDTSHLRNRAVYEKYILNDEKKAKETAKLAISRVDSLLMSGIKQMEIDLLEINNLI